MTSTTVFNVTERPVRYSVHGNRVPGRSSATVTDTADKHYTAALSRGDLVVLSEVASPAKQEQVAKPAPTPQPETEPTPAEDTPAVEAGTEPVADQSDSESKKKPVKAKEN